MSHNSLLDSLFNENLENRKSLIVSPAGLTEFESPNVDTILNKSRLNWTVNKVPLMADGVPSGFYATQRSDTKQCFASFTDAYEIFQNRELAQLVTVLADHFNFEFHNGGSLNGGKKVYIQLAEGSIKQFGLNNDRIDKYVTAINSHDGSTSLNFGSTSITISCQNTFYAAYRGMKNKVRHTEGMRSKIDAAIADIKGLQTEEKSMFDKFFSFVEKPVTPEIIKSVVSEVFEVDLNKSAKELQKELSTRALNQVNDLMISIQGELKQKGQNFWGLFSGFTHYTTHKQSAPNRENGRIESKFIGTAQKIDRDAFKMLSELV